MPNKSEILNTRKASKPRGKSPYASDFKSTICSADHNLLSQRFLVNKLPRKDLEDKYLKLCDENFTIKQENNGLREKMKRLMVQLIKSSNQKKSMVSVAISTGSVQSVDSEKVPQKPTDLDTNELFQKLTALNEAAAESEEKADAEIRDHTLTLTHCHCAKDGSTEKRIHDKIKKLNKELEAAKERNKQLEKDLRSIEHAMIKKNVAANMDIIALKQKIDGLEKIIGQLKTEKKQQEDTLVEMDEKHKGKMARLKTALLNQNGQLEKMEVDLRDQQKLKMLTKQLREDTANLERENQSLKLQHESFSSLLAQSTLQNSEISALRTSNDQLQRKVSAEQSTVDIVGQQQAELLEKLKKVTDEADILSVANEGLKAQNEFLMEKFKQLELAYNNQLKAEQQTIAARVMSEIDSKSMVVNDSDANSSMKIELRPKTLESVATQTSSEILVEEVIERPMSTNSPDDHLKAVNKARDILVNDILSCQPSTSCGISKKLKFTKPQSREEKLKREVEQLKEQIHKQLAKRHISFFGDQGDQRQPRKSFIRGSWMQRPASQQVPPPILPGTAKLTKNWVDLVSKARAQSNRSSNSDSEDNSLSQNIGGQISIEIISLKFLEDSGIFENQTIKQIYVEYSFLGYAGHLLETPQSIAVRSSQDLLVYNFRNTFDVESGYDAEPSYKASILLNMLTPSSKNLLKFVCVSEPTEEDLERNADAECVEIGYGAINLGTLMREAEDDKEELNVYVFSTTYPHKHIGKLQVAIEGFKFMSDFFAANLAH